MAQNSEDANICKEYDRKLMETVCKGMAQLLDEYPGKIRNSCTELISERGGVALDFELWNGFSRRYIIDMDQDWEAAKKAMMKHLKTTASVSGK